MFKFMKKLKEKWKKLNDGNEHNLIDIDVYIPTEVIILFIILLIIILWTILK